MPWPTRGGQVRESKLKKSMLHNPQRGRQRWVALARWLVLRAFVRCCLLPTHNAEFRATSREPDRVRSIFLRLAQCTRCARVGDETESMKPHGSFAPAAFIACVRQHSMQNRSIAMSTVCVCVHVPERGAACNSSKWIACFVNRARFQHRHIRPLVRATGTATPWSQGLGAPLSNPGVRV